jgi:hypothetical protein
VSVFLLTKCVEGSDEMKIQMKAKRVAIFSFRLANPVLLLDGWL